MNADRAASRPGVGSLILGVPTVRGWGVVSDVLLLGTRLFAGLWMMGAGLDKLPTPPWLVEQVEFVGFPMAEWSAFFASMSEFAGGLLLAVGLLARPAALFLAFTMGVAVYFHHKKDGVDFFLDWHMTKQFFWTYVALLAVGPGRISIDAILRAAFTRANDAGVRTLRAVPAIGVGVLLALPVLGYGAFREATMTWEDPDAAPETDAGEPGGIGSMSVAGTFNQWDLAATPMERGDDGVWRAEVELPAGPTGFKFAANETWDVNVGEADQGGERFPLAGTGEPGAGNVAAYIPAAGLYRFTLDDASRSYTLDAVESDPPDPDAAGLVGTWDVDLRPSPDSAANVVSMVIRSVEGGVLQGSFYDGSEMTEGRVTTSFGVVRFAFVTSDGSGLYHTTGELRGGRVTGVTHAIERNFLMPWRGERAE